MALLLASYYANSAGFEARKHKMEREGQELRNTALSLLLVCVAIMLAGSAALAQTVIADVPMDQQINLGYTFNTSQSPGGNAIYDPFGGGVITFETDGSDGWTRQNIVAPSWWYLYLDLNLAGITTPTAGLDITTPGKLYKLQFDCRYYQSETTNSNPYGDAPVFLRLYTYGTNGDTYLGHRDYSIVYATQAPWSNPHYPAWTHVSVVLNNSQLQAYTDGGTFNPANISRIRWYGTDWSGNPGDSDDFVDIKNVQFTEETMPATVSGVVTDGSGNPVAGAIVGVKSTANAAADAMRYATTGADGAYSFLLEAGTWYVAAWRPGYAPTPDTVVNMAGLNIPNTNFQVATLAGDNIAPTGTATATSVSESATYAIDDNLGTRWISVNPLGTTEQDQSYTIDLGSVRNITGITIGWENAYPADYEILTTTGDPNGAPTWTQVYSVAGGSGGWQMPGSSLHLDPIGLPQASQARAIRIHATKFGPYPVYSAWEIYVHGTTTTTTPVGAMTIQAAKALADGATVQLIKPVSASGMWNGGESAQFRNKFWMEEPDRSSGIRIDMVDHWCWPGELDYVKGVMATDPVTGERYILGESTNWFGTAPTEIRPFAMANKSLTSGGALPVGMLVKTWGTVKSVETDGYTISDGSGDGVKVVTEGILPSVGTFVTVTGPLSGEPTIYVKPGDGFIRTWLVQGAYSVPDPGATTDPQLTWQQLNLDTDFLASVGGEAAIQPAPGDLGPNGGKWYVYTTSDWQLPLSSMTWTPSGQGQSAIYASVWVYADRQYMSMDGFLGTPNDGLQVRVGSDDGYKLYINGEAIYEKNIWRGAAQDQDLIDYKSTYEPFVLNQGWNHIMLKSNNITGGWSIGLRFMADDPVSLQKVPLNLTYQVVP